MASKTNMRSPFITIYTFTVRGFNVGCNILMIYSVYVILTYSIDKSWNTLGGRRGVSYSKSRLCNTEDAWIIQ